MAIKKIITIDGIDVPFKASAAVPRLYRMKFHRDIYKDFAVLQKSVNEQKKNDTPEDTEENPAPRESGLDIESLEVFENLAWTMAFPMTRMTGWKVSMSFQFMKFCRNLSNYGA